MDKQVEIKKIVIRIGDKEASLTLEDAKALRDVLDSMFGKEKEKEYVPYYPWYPYWQPYNPLWITWTSGSNNAEWNWGTLYLSASAGSQSSMLSG